MEQILDVEITLPMPWADEPYVTTESVTLAELTDLIRVYSKPSMYGPTGFSIRILPR